jgi:predicted flap endonuclease-1-like 5' DNA nuclease
VVVIMADERTGVAYVSGSEADEIELIDDLEPLEDGDAVAADDATTGTHARQDAPSVPPARASSPPPVPPEARQSRPPEARTGIGFPSPRQPSQSGMFRIEHPSPPPPARASVPPGAPGVTTGPETPSLPPFESDAMRETHAYAQRLRLMLRLREDRIRELENELREQRERADRFARELSQLTSQPLPDDLKLISGIGPGFERALRAAGVTTFEQIAHWSIDDVARIAAEIRTVPQRIVRGRWVERAQEILAERAAR